MKKEIITICGGLGSGKSTTANEIARILNYKRFSSGDLFRQIAVDLNLSVVELNKKAETDKHIDFLVDDKLRNLNHENQIVIDSRTAFHWIPKSFRVYLYLDPEVAKFRVLNSLKEDKNRQKTEKETTIENVYEKMKERLISEQKRYWDLYKIDNTKKENFDLIINTGENNLEQVVQTILEEYQKWLKT